MADTLQTTLHYTRLRKDVRPLGEKCRPDTGKGLAQIPVKFKGHMSANTTFKS